MIEAGPPPAEKPAANTQQSSGPEEKVTKEQTNKQTTSSRSRNCNEWIMKRPYFSILEKKVDRRVNVKGKDLTPGQDLTPGRLLFMRRVFWRGGENLLFLLGLTGALAVCNSPIVPIVPPSPTRSSTFAPTEPVAAATSRAPLAPIADIVIHPEQVGQPDRVEVGQTLAVLIPSESFGWQVAFSSFNLLSLTPPDKMNSPGPTGWRFQAIQPGEAQITLTSTVPPCPTPRCPPPRIQEFVIKLRVQQPQFK